MSNTRKNAILVWLPRLLAIAFAIFISLFATDVFGEDISISEWLLAFLIHMIPTLLIIAALAVAWRFRMVGGVLFIALSIAYIVMSRVSLTAILIIAVPLLVIGLLFLATSNFSTYEMIKKTTVVD